MFPLVLQIFFFGLTVWGILDNYLRIASTGAAVAARVEVLKP
jgi:hypothetical protein